MNSEQKRELRDLIRGRIEPGMSADEVADRIAAMFVGVADDWIEFDVSTLAEAPGSRIRAERWLVARVHRETHTTTKPQPNRAAEKGA